MDANIKEEREGGRLGRPPVGRSFVFAAGGAGGDFLVQWKLIGPSFRKESDGRLKN